MQLGLVFFPTFLLALKVYLGHIHGASGTWLLV